MRQWCNLGKNTSMKGAWNWHIFGGDWYTNTPRHMCMYVGHSQETECYTGAMNLNLPSLLDIYITVIFLFWFNKFMYRHFWSLPQPGVPVRIRMQWHRLGCGLWDRVAVARQLPRHYQPASARPRSHRIGTHGCLLFGERGLHRIHHAPLQPAYYGSLSNTLQERYHKDSNKCQTQYRWRSNSSTYQSADIFHISKLFSTKSSVHLDVILVNFHDGRIIYKWVLEYNVGSACGGIGTALHVSMSTESDGMHSVNLQQSQNLLLATTVQQQCNSCTAKSALTLWFKNLPPSPLCWVILMLRLVCQFSKFVASVPRNATTSAPGGADRALFIAVGQ